MHNSFVLAIRDSDALKYESDVAYDFMNRIKSINHQYSVGGWVVRNALCFRFYCGMYIIYL